jgi:23S rRNA-/tRNA-specific pseudouridylate synthase
MIQVAVNKPSGLQVLPGGLFQQRTVLTQLQWRSDSNDKQATHGIAALHEKDLWKTSLAHHLGRGASGVLLSAKSPAAKSQIAADLATSTFASNKSRLVVISHSSINL